MAVLTDAQRFAAWAEYMREEPLVRESIAISKSDLRAAIDAADSWADTNAVSFNLALPLAARSGLTARQKARLLLYVINKRYRVQ